VCDKSFIQKAQLIQHERVHAGVMRFFCDKCDRGFKTKYSLNQHKKIHADGQPISCKYCAKPFANKYQLIEHERTHTKEKPYTCELCGRPFPRKDTLNRHKRLVHGLKKPKTTEKDSIVDIKEEKLSDMNEFLKVDLKEDIAAVDNKEGIVIKEELDIKKEIIDNPLDVFIKSENI
jgi:uncharacterized Zn-finger protein